MFGTQEVLILLHFFCKHKGISKKWDQDPRVGPWGEILRSDPRVEPADGTLW